MFDYLKKHNIIFVTGPHRTGTRFTSKNIANDLGYKWNPEVNGWNYRYYISKLQGALKNGTKEVFQCPNLACFCQLLPPPVAIIFMIRPVEDIVVSERRINWGSPGKGNEAKEYAKYYREPDTNRPVADLQYEIWKKYQKPKIRYAYEIEYNSLVSHPKFVKKEKRLNFKPLQTEVKNA